MQALAVLALALGWVAPIEPLPRAGEWLVLAATAQKAPARCPGCRKAVQPAWKFCESCGRRLASASTSAKPYTPKLGSAERKAILDALRVPVGKSLGGKKVVFVPTHFLALDGWAFLFGEPREANGKPLDLRGTPYLEAFEAGAWDSNVSGLLRKVDGKWKVLAHVVGATDVPWVDWPQKFKAPKAIFPPLN